MTSCRKIVKSLLFFQFTPNLEQSGTRIPNTESVKLYIFINLIIISFINFIILQKLKTELKNL